jgi:glutathione S-transferase
LLTVFAQLKQEKGVDALIQILQDTTTTTPPFAPPFIKEGDQYIGQTSVILDYLATRLGLAPKVP